METQLGRLEAALRGHEQASDLFRKLVEEAPRIAMPGAYFAASLGNVANLRSIRHDQPEPGSPTGKCSRSSSSSSPRSPRCRRYRDDLALTYNNMAFREEDSQVAVRDLRKAIELREQLLALDPTNQYRRRNVARSCQNLGVYEYDQGAIPRQSSCKSGAAACSKRSSSPSPQTRRISATWPMATSTWAIVWGAAAGPMNQSRAVAGPGRSLNGCWPPNPGWTLPVGLMGALSNISEALSQKGQFAEAAEPIEKAVKIARERVRELPEDSERKRGLAEKLT